MDNRLTHSTNTQSLPELAERAIGIFDSGVGGLTVAKEIYQILPDEATIYLGDTARIPYGTRSKETVIKFAKEDVEFLLSYDVKAIVIACNTASSQAEDLLKRSYDLPFFGVVEPACWEAHKKTLNGRIGIIGTPGTIGSGAHERLLKRLDPTLHVSSIACPLLVPLIEDGRISGPLIENVVVQYLLPIKKEGIDTLILGCTHYPLIRDVITDYLSERVKLVDPGAAVARKMVAELGRQGLRSSRKEQGKRQHFITDYSPTFRQNAERFLGEPLKDLQKVELS
jgi:glutamate racemase